MYYYLSTFSLTVGPRYRWLSQTFRYVLLGTVVRISSLDIGERYPILHVERLETKYGTSVRLTIRESTDNIIKVFLSRRYSMVFSEDDITAIIDKTLLYHLTYKGKCFKSNS